MKNLKQKTGSALAVVTAMTMLSTLSTFAAPEDVIDSSQKANFTIHKYDVTAARAGGVDFDKAGFANNGKEDLAAEEALKNYAIEGVEFSYVKVGDIHTDSKNGNVQVLYDIPDALETTLKLTDTRGNNHYTSTELNKALADTLVTHTAGTDAIEEYVTNAAGKQAMTLTDVNGETTATSLPLGLYLVTETKVPANVHTTTDPFFVSLPMTDMQGDAWFYDVEVYPKNQTDHPDLDKLVKQHDDVSKNVAYEDSVTASKGDVLDYIFVSHLPKITTKATYLSQYTYVDQIDAGMKYNNDFSILFFDNAEDAKANRKENAKTVWEAGSPNFHVEFGATTPTAPDMTESPVTPLKTATIQMTESGLSEINTTMSSMYMVVSYSCTLNSDLTCIPGDQGNANNVELSWKRTSSAYFDTLKDRAKVYTYGLNIKKLFDEQDGKRGNPKEVQFVLQNKTDGYYVTAAASGDGVYHVTDATKGASEQEGTVFTPDVNGTLKIDGLEADVYTLTEIATDHDYALLKEPMTIDIKSTVGQLVPSKSTLYDQTAVDAELVDQLVSNASATIDTKTSNMSAYTDKGINSTNARVDMTIVNSRNLKLPKTGGAGTLALTLLGGGTALAGVFLLSKKSNKNVKQKAK